MMNYMSYAATSFESSNVESDAMARWNSSFSLKIMSIDTRIEKELQMEYFWFIDEFAASLRTALDKKEFAETPA